MAVLRTWAEVKAFDGGPTDAEMELIEACKADRVCQLKDGTVPIGPWPERTIRAEILRYLLLGGCPECKVGPNGVMLFGAYIAGFLKLNFETMHGATAFIDCRFEHEIESIQTRFQICSFNGSALAGWNTVGATVDGSILMNNITSPQIIDCRGVRIVGQLSLTGSQLTNKKHYALNLSDSKIEGGVFLHPRTQDEKDEILSPLYCTGEIRLNGATVGGLYAQNTTLIAGPTHQSLSLGGATINGPVKLDGCDSSGEILLAGSRITGRVTCERMKIRNAHGHAFNGQAMKVEHAFVWKKVDHDNAPVSLNGAHVATLEDDPANWPNQDNLFLDGFTYDRIKGTVSTASDRMGWLANGSTFGPQAKREFRPQPYSQYAKFLRDTGHDEDARRVLFERERLRRASIRQQFKASGHSLAAPINLWARFWDMLLRAVVGYGHFPFRSVAALAILIICATLPAHYAWEEGSFAPNAAPILVSPDWTALSDNEPNPGAVWAGERVPQDSALSLEAWKAIAPGRDWESFNAISYGFDVVIPIIDFGQTDAWAPSTTRGDWGWHLWWGRWVLSVMGWIVTALGAAAITGIIRRD